MELIEIKDLFVWLFLCTINTAKVTQWLWSKYTLAVEDFADAYTKQNVY